MTDADDRGSTASMERAALAELERLQRELEALRTRRQAAAAAFDRLIQTFDGEAAGRAAAPTVAVSAAPELLLDEAATDRVPASPPAAPEALRVQRPAEASAPAAAGGVPAPLQQPTVVTRSSREASEGPRASRLPLVTSPAQAPEGRKASRQAHTSPVPGVALAAVAVLVLIAAVVLMPRGGERAAPGDAPAVVAAPIAAPEPEPAPAVPPPPRAELEVQRPVWVRVTVDGERVLERELAAGVRVPLTDGKTIVVRAGDAGALRLWMGGEDRGTLGPDGAVVTRTVELE